MTFHQIQAMIDDITKKLVESQAQLSHLRTAIETLSQSTDTGTISPFVMGLTVFVLAVFVGYYVVWKVTPALHSPLMAVTNAISSVIIVGALIALGTASNFSVGLLGFFAVLFASINIFGGFIVTRRMLHMFQKKN